MNTSERGELGRGRGSAVGLMLLAVVLFATAIGVAVVQRENHRTAADARLRNAAEQEASVLEDYFERSRAAILLTSQNPAFTGFYAEPGDLSGKVEARIPQLRAATRALAYLETLYPNSIGEACFIDASGVELARVVRGQVAPISELSPDESGNPFFAPTVSLASAGDVYQAKPYVSPDTGEWVIANSTQVREPQGRTQAIVHFEVTVESFRRTAAEAVLDDDLAILVVDGATGAIVIDSRHPQEVGAPLGEAVHGRFAFIASEVENRGVLETEEGRAAFARLARTQGNANDWIVVAVTSETAPFGGIGLGTLILGLAAALLFVIGAIGFRAVHDELTKAALSDGLTGLGNRRALLADLDGRYREGGALTLALYDLDGFKTYNDTFGHPAGDALLARLADNLRHAAGADASAYRLGGDEFCLLVQGSRADETVASGVVALSEIGDGFTITASSGMVHRDEAEDADEMLRLADKRMYAEKHARRVQLDTHSRDVLLAALEARYPELLQHRDELAGLAESTAKALGLDENQIVLVRRAAELHDVGKVAIPDSILRKSGDLTDEEWEFVRRHSEVGQRILDAVPALTEVGRLIRAHHERWDGTGYPDRLRGDEIPLGARIVSVVDAYHAMMLEDRPHRPRVTSEAALSELLAHAGEQFDPRVIDAFVEAMRSTIRV